MIRSLLSFFDNKDKLKLLALFIAILFLGIIEIISISLIMPFMALIANPEFVYSNTYLNAIYTALNLTSSHQFIFILGMIVLAFLLLSNTYAALVTWASIRFSYVQGHTMGRKLLLGYLSQPYIFFVNHHSSTLFNNITSEVGQLIGMVLNPFLLVVKAIFVILCIVLLLFLIDPLLAFIICVILGGLYLALAFGVRKRLTHIGEVTLHLRERMIKALHEALQGIKDIKLLGKENAVLAEFDAASLRIAKYQAQSHAFATLPRYLLEVIAFGGILLITLYLLQIKNNITQVLPLISLYAFAGYRLLPLLQQIINGLANIRFSLPTLYSLQKEFTFCAQNQHPLPTEKPVPLAFHKQIAFKQVTYRYPQSHQNSIQPLSLTIAKNTTVGFVGPTGSGKTTLIDLLLGLLQPDEGGIYIDNALLTPHTIKAWQSQIGYVSQHLYLHDTSIAKNIALGVDDSALDLEKIQKAAQLAHIADFIEALPLGYQTQVGEQGLRLSGGQRQRIAIARALYHEPEVLVFDEATSALDNATESAVMDALESLNHKKTIILIAHRLTTLKNCDTIFVLEAGQLVEQGDYQAIVAGRE